jgi:signal transduction histidine kinase
MRLEKKLTGLLLAALVASWIGCGLVIGYELLTLNATAASSGVLQVRSLLVSSIVSVSLIFTAVGTLALVGAYFMLLAPLRELNAMYVQVKAAQEHSDASLDALEQLRHSDRVSTLGRMASSVAHELGNPLNVIEIRAQLIASGEMSSTASIRENAAIILTQAKRMTRIISEILSFARHQPSRVTQLDLVRVAQSAIALSEHTARKRKSSIHFAAPHGALDIEADEDKLVQVIVNLVMNGLQATEAGGTVNVCVQSARCAPHGDPHGVQQTYACIDVVDHGVGIPQESLTKIFEPFFSSKYAEGGTGLGLAVAQGIAKEHQGWIEVQSALGHGSSFRVFLPCAAGYQGNVAVLPAAIAASA